LDASTAAPAGNAPASSGTQPNGAAGQQTPAKTPPPETVVRPRPAAKQATTKERGPDGKFAPKAEEKPPEPYRFKKRIKVDGGEEDVDYSEDDLQREVQIARAARKRLAELNRRSKELDAREARLKEAPHEFLEKAGHDPDKWAAERLAKKAQDGLMSEEERAFRAIQEENAQLKAERDSFKKQQAEREFKEVEDKHWAQTEPRLMSALEKANLPRGADVMGRIADVGIEFLDGGMDLSPEDIVAEVSLRMDRDASRYVLSLPTEQLAAKLGPEKVKALVADYTRKWKESQAAFNDNPVQPQREAPPENGERRKFLTEREVDERSRLFSSKL
jgi:hypothetical protein